MKVLTRQNSIQSGLNLHKCGLSSLLLIDLPELDLRSPCCPRIIVPEQVLDACCENCFILGGIIHDWFWKVCY